MIQYENIKNMTSANRAAAVADETKRVMLKDIGAKWDRLSEADIAACKGPNDLVKKLVEKYGADTEQAASDVKRFLKGRTF